MIYETRVRLDEILDDWFEKNQYGDAWAGGPTTPDTWMLLNPSKEDERVDAETLVVAFVQAEPEED